MVAGLVHLRAIIQPKWPMEEKAIIGRSCVCPIPPRPPVNVLRMAISSGSEVEVHFMVVCRTAKGATFCHVVRINRLSQFIEEATGGSQK